MKATIVSELPDGRIQLDEHDEKIIISADEFQKLQTAAGDQVLWVRIVDEQLQRRRNESNSDSRER